MSRYLNSGYSCSRSSIMLSISSTLSISSLTLWPPAKHFAVIFHASHEFITKLKSCSEIEPTPFTNVPRTRHSTSFICFSSFVMAYLKLLRLLVCRSAWADRVVANLKQVAAVATRQVVNEHRAMILAGDLAQLFTVRLKRLLHFIREHARPHGLSDGTAAQRLHSLSQQEVQTSALSPAR